MSDLSDIQSALSTKIVGSDSTGLETTPVASDTNGNLKVIDYSTSATAASVPSDASYTAGRNPSGNLQGMSVDASGRVNVDLYDSSGNGIGSVSSGGINNIAVAIGGANYVFSTVNSSTAQLSAGATFTGTIETAVNQPSYSILLTCDQPVTITINQYIDAAGSFLAYSEVFSVNAGQGWARSDVVNGNYINVTVRNIGISSTTTFNLNVAYGTIPSATNLNNQPTALNEANGIALTATPYGNFSVSTETTALFSDSFDSAGFDSTNRWNSAVVSGAGAVAQSLGTLTLSTGTAASSAVAISSQATFLPLGLNFYSVGCIAQVEANIITNTHRFWGVGTPNGSFTAATPLLNAIGFEIDITGNFNAVIYSNGTKIFSNNLNVYKSFIQGTPGIIGLTFRADVAYFFVGTTQIPVATAALLSPDSLNLPIRMHVINHTSVPASAPTFKVQALAMGDSGGNNKTISDGNYPWRKTNVTSTAALRTISDVSAAATQGAAFVVCLDTINISSAESGVLLLTNPSNSGKTAYLTLLAAGATPASNNWVKCRLNIGPTITANGTTQTPVNTKAGSGIASSMTVFTAPTFSAKGSQVATVAAPAGALFGSSSNAIGSLDPYIVVPAGQSILVTGLAQANNIPSLVTLAWFEA